MNDDTGERRHFPILVLETHGGRGSGLLTRGSLGLPDDHRSAVAAVVRKLKWSRWLVEGVWER